MPEGVWAVVPGTETVEIALLSVATTVKVTVCDWEEVLRSTLVSSALKLPIDGFWSSVLVTLTEIVWVALFPAASVAVAVKVSEVVPKLKSL